MAIKTIVKANIRSHFAQFIGVIVLMTVAMSSITGFSQLMISTNASIAQEAEAIGMPDEFVVVQNSVVDEAFREKLDDSAEISDYEISMGLGLHSIYVEGTDVENNNSEVYSNQCFLRANDGRYPVLNSAMTGYEDEHPDIKTGEIYLACGITEAINAAVGDNIVVKCENLSRTYRLAGIIEEPMGSQTVGWKNVIVSQEDFDEFSEAVHDMYDGSGFESDYDFACIELNWTESDMSTYDIRKAVNKETGIYDYSAGSIAGSDLVYYSGLLVTVVAAILIAVSVLLIIVLLVVITHNISSTIKTDYKNLGIMKSQGFGSHQIRLIYVMQYLIGEVLGAVLGIIGGYFLCRFLLSKMASLTGFILAPHLSWIVVFGIFVGVIVVSLLIIFLSTSKIRKISPCKAITEGSDDISFSSRIHMPVSKRFLSASIAARNITSSLSQYVGIVITAAILTALVIFSTVASTCFSAKNTVLSMQEAGELAVYHYGELSDDEREELNDLISEHTGITSVYAFTSNYISYDGTNIYTCFCENPENIQNVYEGRAPKYDNEIVIGKGFAANTGKGIGDTVVLSNNDCEYEYIITGFVNTTNDLGNVIKMGLEAAEHIGITDMEPYISAVFVLENSEDPTAWYPYEDTKIIADEINDRFDNLNAVAEDMDVSSSDIGSVTAIVSYSIYAIAAMFVIVIVSMTCTSCFNSERRFLGIYKAQGFTSARLRLQFAFRFGIVFAVGSVLGILISFFAVNSLFEAILGILGVASMKVDITPANIITSFLVVVLAAFIVAFLCSGRIKKVDVNELVCE